MDRWCCGLRDDGYGDALGRPRRQKKPPLWAAFSFMAVGQGFEPREPLGSTVFKTAAFDHSASPPKLFAGKAPGEERALYRRALSDQVSPLPIRLRVALSGHCSHAMHPAARPSLEVLPA